MNTPYQKRSQGHLRAYVVVIFLSLVGLAYMVACVSARAWHLALILPVGLVALAIALFLYQILWDLAIAPLIFYLLFLLSRLIPRRARDYLVANHKLHPMTAFICIVVCVGVLIGLFTLAVGDFAVVLTFFLSCGLIVGIFALLQKIIVILIHWIHRITVIILQRRKKSKMETASQSSQPVGAKTAPEHECGR